MCTNIVTFVLDISLYGNCCGFRQPGLKQLKDIGFLCYLAVSPYHHLTQKSAINPLAPLIPTQKYAYANVVHINPFDTL